MTHVASTPLYKNEEAGHYEAIYEGHHIVVPLTVFNLRLARLQAQRIEKGTEPNAAGDLAYFDIIDAEQWNQPIYWHIEGLKNEEEAAQEADTHAETDGFFISMEISAQGDEAALERMAEYFYDLYQKASPGTVQESRYASIYNQVMGTLTRREIAHHLETVTAQIDTLMGVILTTIGTIAEHFATTEEGSATDAGSDTPAPTSQS